MGRMECYKKDAYHVGKHSRTTPCLAQAEIYFLGITVQSPDEIIQKIEKIVNNNHITTRYQFPLTDNGLRSGHCLEG